MNTYIKTYTIANRKKLNKLFIGIYSLINIRIPVVRIKGTDTFAVLNQNSFMCKPIFFFDNTNSLAPHLQIQYSEHILMMLQIVQDILFLKK